MANSPVGVISSSWLIRAHAPNNICLTHHCFVLQWAST